MECLSSQSRVVSPTIIAMRRPLIYLPGDLGLSPTDVEKNLDFNFQLAESWGCVLLLDEADVFLSQRNTSDVERNALVSSEFYTPEIMG